MNYTTVGVDIAKSVFQLHWVDGLALIPAEPDSSRGTETTLTCKRKAFK